MKKKQFVDFCMRKDWEHRIFHEALRVFTVFCVQCLYSSSNFSCYIFFLETSKNLELCLSLLKALLVTKTILNRWISHKGFPIYSNILFKCLIFFHDTEKRRILTHTRPVYLTTGNYSCILDSKRSNPPLIIEICNP